MSGIRAIVRHFRLERRRRRFGSIGKYSVVPLSGVFGDPNYIHIGDYVYIGPEPYIWGRGGIMIEDYSILGPRVSIHSITHRYEDAELLPYDDMSYIRPVHIGPYVWIGGHVCIVPGVTIEEGAVVAMGAVVTKDVPKCAVVGGNPAQVIKYRDTEKYELLKSQGRGYWKFKSDNPRYVASD